MSYKPNINDPRVLRRIKKALGFVGACLSNNKPHSWSTRYIDKHLGHQSDDLSKWLRTKLIICTNDRYKFNVGSGNSICKEYIKNSVGYNEMVSLLEKTTSYPIVRQVGSLEIEFVKEEFKDELATKNFVYNDKSNRLWHTLQRVRKEYKLVVFNDSGLNYQYDIECCMPTLIHQYSQKLNMDLYLPALRTYLKDRKQIRQELAEQTEISIEIAKEIINALVNGAQLGRNKKSDIYQILDGDIARIEFLKQHEYLKQLRLDIKTCWDYISPTIPRKSIKTKSSKIRLLPISSKQKASVYFDLERQVLNSIRSYLDNTNNNYFLEHDGWVCTNEIDMDSLIKWVKDSTGYDINLDRTNLLEKTTSYPIVRQVIK